MPETQYEDISNKYESIKRETLPHREIILGILSRAAEDQKFLARLAEKPHTVLLDYDLNPEERLALVNGDLTILESWVGRLDGRMKTWFNVRKAQSKW